MGLSTRIKEIAVTWFPVLTKLTVRESASFMGEPKTFEGRMLEVMTERWREYLNK